MTRLSPSVDEGWRGACNRQLTTVHKRRESRSILLPLGTIEIQIIIISKVRRKSPFDSPGFWKRPENKFKELLTAVLLRKEEKQ